jgi:Icc-related predicted phosphoesterase
MAADRNVYADDDADAKAAGEGDYSVKVLVFSDIHGDLKALARIVAQPADVYIDAGDLATFGKGLERCGDVLKPLGEKLWVLPGNHETHQSMRELSERLGFVDFHRQVRALESTTGVSHWAGLGYSNITPFDTPGEYSEEEIADALSAFNGIKPLYLVAHCPPAGTRLDEYAPGKHAGRPRFASGWSGSSPPISSADTSMKQRGCGIPLAPPNASTWANRASQSTFSDV